MRQRPVQAWRPTAVLAAALFALAADAASAQENAEVDETALAYCTNLADAASDARFARKLARLQEAEAQIDQRLTALEQKRAEYEEWLDRRKRFLKQAEQNLVSIYSGMRPDAAGQQLAEMDEITAAAVIAKVPARTASAILNEMEAEKAARIATIMAGLSRTERTSG